MLLEKPSDLEMLERFLIDLTSNLLLQSGSVFRIASHALENWGIGLTDENRELIKSRSEGSVAEEWDQDGELLNIAINNASAMAGLEEGNPTLNNVVAGITYDLLGGYANARTNQERIFVLDLGAGAGGTTSSALRQLETSPDEEDRAILRRCRFQLLEPTGAVHEASKSIGVRRRISPDAYTKESVSTFVQGDDGFLECYRDGKFDIIMSNAALHHKAFPDYLAEVRRILKDDGAIVLGDWYTTIWRYPAYVIPLLRALGADIHQISAFRDRFGLSNEVCRTVNNLRSTEEREAQFKMVAYLKCLGQIIASINQEREERASRTGESPPPKLRCCFLEAHESLGDRQRTLREKGFETDLMQLKERNPVFRRIRKSPEDALPRMPGFACVMAAGKRRS